MNCPVAIAEINYDLSQNKHSHEATEWAKSRYVAVCEQADRFIAGEKKPVRTFSHLREGYFTYVYSMEDVSTAVFENDFHPALLAGIATGKPDAVEHLKELVIRKAREIAFSALAMENEFLDLETLEDLAGEAE